MQEKQDFRATSIETLRQMVAAGAGVTLLPALASRGAYGNARGVTVRPFGRPVPSRRIGAVWRKSSARIGAITAVCDQIARHCGLARAMSNAAADVSVYDRMCWPDGQLELALAGGAHRRELMAYFGPGEYAMLARAGRASVAGTSVVARPRHARAIYLLPGLLGSQLGRLRGAGQPPDLLWLDPSDVINGRLTALAAASGISPSGHAAVQLPGAEAAPECARLRRGVARL